MGNLGRSFSFLPVLFFVVLALLATACNGSDDEPTGTTSLPATTSAAVAPESAVAPEQSAEPALVVGELEWESLNGPPGGNIGLMAQDNYRPEHIYALSGSGLYRSSDQAGNWVRFAEETIRDVTDIAFGPHGVYACGSVGLIQVQPDGTETRLADNCLTVAVSEGFIYASHSSEHFSEPRVELLRAALGTEPPTPESLVWVDVTPPYESLASRVTPEVSILGIDDLLVLDTTVIASVTLSSGPLFRNSVASEVFTSNDDGDTWTRAEIEFPDPLVMQKVVYSEDAGLLFALAHVHITDGPFFAIADLMRVSRDGGRTWAPFTENREIVSATIGDVEVRADHYVLTNVDFALALLDRADPNRLLGAHIRPDVVGYSDGYTIEELIYDSAAPGVIYGKPYLDFEGVARSRDDGATWEATSNGISAAPTGNVNTHPDDPDVLVASGNLGYVPHMTRDGGATWTALIATANMADEIAFDPHDPQHMLFMSESSKFLESFDGGLTWADVDASFTANRVHSLALSADEDVLFASNLGSNISSITGVRPGDAVPMGYGENAWANMISSPDYAYAIATAPDGTLFASYSPKKFEDYGAVWRYRGGPEGEPTAWDEVLRVPGATGVTDIAIGPGSPYTVYAGATGESAEMWVSRDGGDNWRSVHDDGFGFVTVHAVVIDPEDSTTIYAAPWGDGLYRSSDRGQTWQKLSVPTVSVAAIVVDPLDTGHIIAGDRTRPIVWESWDSGLTWNSLVDFDEALHYRVMAMAMTDEGVYVSLLDRNTDGLAIFAGVPESGSTFLVDLDGPHQIEELTRSVLSFADQGDAVYAVTHLSGVYEIYGDEVFEISEQLPDMGFNHVLAGAGRIIVSGGSDVDTEFRARIGDPSVVHNIYAWVEDGAWQPLLDGDPFNSAIKQLVRHDETGTLVAATGTGVYVSTDDGLHWAAQNEGLDFVNIGAIAMTDDIIVVGTLGAGVAVGTLTVSDSVADAHIEWRTDLGPRSDIANIRIETDPLDPSRLWASSYPGGVFRSADGGTTWTESNFGIPSFDVADPLLQGYYSLVVDPANPDRLLLSVFEHGVFESRNGGATWRPLGTYGANQEAMRAGLTALAIDGRNDDRLWLGTSDRGVFMSPDRGATWEPFNEGLTTVEILTLETASSGAVFAGTAGYGVFMLDAGATTWQHLGNTVGFGLWTPWDRRLYQYGSFLFDPVDEGRVYLGHFPSGFFYSTDGGHSWESGNIGLGNDGMFSLVAHPTEPNVLFAGTYNGIARSDDRGHSWRDVSEGIPPEQWPFSVIIDDESPNVMYTATKNGQNKGFCGRNSDTFCGTVMRSVNGGETWTDIGGGLPTLAEFYMILFDPRDHDVLYLTSSRGVFVSPDQGASWTQMNGGLPEIEEFIVRDNVAHNMELTADARSLVLTIVGYGVWQTELPELSHP